MISRESGERARKVTASDRLDQGIEGRVDHVEVGHLAMFAASALRRTGPLVTSSAAVARVTGTTALVAEERMMPLRGIACIRSRSLLRADGGCTDYRQACPSEMLIFVSPQLVRRIFETGR